MPRPLLIQPGFQQQQRTQLNLNQEVKQKSKTRQMTEMELDRYLKKKRSDTYVKAMKRLDVGGRMNNQRMVEELKKIIMEELPEIEIEMGPIGIVSKCYLGAPYEVHTLDLTGGGIIEHFETFRAMPGKLEVARKLAKNDHYAFIEVYNTSLRAVSDNGNVAVLKV